MTMIEVLGAIGSVCFAVCGVPAAISALRHKTVDYDWTFLGLWALGELSMIGYALGTWQPWLLLNYGGNGLCLVIIIYYNKKGGLRPRI